MPFDHNVKIIAFYLPQYHRIIENDLWWGKGFTDWVNIKKARPLLREHYQPRVPLNKRYYDLSQKEIIEWQVKLAKTFGVNGFCHYHYWFDGKQLLEKPTNIFINSKEIDFRFCLAWANETWSRRWDGQDHHILQLQTHEPNPKLWQRHFDYLINAWTDERAIRIDGKPIFLIYRSHKIIDIGNMFDFWQTKAIKYGVDGIYFIAMKQYEFPNPNILKYFDAVAHFQPFEAMYSVSSEHKDSLESLFIKAYRKFVPHNIQMKTQKTFSKLQWLFGGAKLFEYDEVWPQILRNSENLPISTYPSAFVDWDNTARYGRRATIFRGANPERFGYWLKRLVELVKQRPENKQIIFLNAWNEWAESAYLEPDERYHYMYLEALQKALT